MNWAIIFRGLVLHYGDSKKVCLNLLRNRVFSSFRGNILWFDYLFFRYLHGCVQSCDDIDACNSSLRNTISIALLPLLFAILGLQVSFLFRNYIVVSERVLWEPLKREWTTNFIRPKQSLITSFKYKKVSIIHFHNVPLNAFFSHHPYVIYYTTPYYVNCDK